MKSENYIKLEFPSKSVNEGFGGTKQNVYGRHGMVGERSGSEIGIHAVRGGTIVGEHEIIFAGRDEVIELKHTAMSREIFAVGAVNAAVYLADSVYPRIYTMSDLL